MKKNMQSGGILMPLLVLIVLALVVGGIYYSKSGSRSGLPAEITFSTAPGMTRLAVADAIGSQLKWTDAQKHDFASTYAQMQWIALSGTLEEVFVEKFQWNETEKEAFMTSSARYLSEDLDFLSTVHADSSYTFPGTVSIPVLADTLTKKLVETQSTNLKAFIAKNLSEPATTNIHTFVQSKIELLPDLVPLPPLDLVLNKNAEGQTLLSFSTSYYNQGTGPLEFIADPATKGVRADIERNVFQRIYRTDDMFIDTLVGKFLWHQAHLHYHFVDFVIYDLEAVDVPGNPDLSGVRAKSTFCIRDTSKVTLDLSTVAAKADYLICGKERQGISAGWADTYFYNYPDQNLNLTDLPSGTYKLSFIVNPEKRFKEANMDNNKSSVIIKIDMAKLTFDVLEEIPATYPKIEHIYYDQIFTQ